MKIVASLQRELCHTCAGSSSCSSSCQTLFHISMHRTSPISPLGVFLTRQGWGREYLTRNDKDRWCGVKSWALLALVGGLTWLETGHWLLWNTDSVWKRSWPHWRRPVQSPFIGCHRLLVAVEKWNHRLHWVELMDPMLENNSCAFLKQSLNLPQKLLPYNPVL